VTKDPRQELFDDLTGRNGADKQTFALLDSIRLMVDREFEDRRVTGAGDVKSDNLGGQSFLYTD
jgi:hypothetical protein